jgi:hypothetical protein
MRPLRRTRLSRHPTVFGRHPEERSDEGPLFAFIFLLNLRSKRDPSVWMTAKNGSVSQATKLSDTTQLELEDYGQAPARITDIPGWK